MSTTVKRSMKETRRVMGRIVTAGMGGYRCVSTVEGHIFDVAKNPHMIFALAEVSAKPKGVRLAPGLERKGLAQILRHAYYGVRPGHTHRRCGAPRTQWATACSTGATRATSSRPLNGLRPSSGRHTSARVRPGKRALRLSSKGGCRMAKLAVPGDGARLHGAGRSGPRCVRGRMQHGHSRAA